MQFEQIKAYVESAGMHVNYEDGKTPFRRMLVKKGIVGEEIYESDFVHMEETEQEDFLANLVKAINDMYNVLEHNKQKKGIVQPHKEGN